MAEYIERDALLQDIEDSVRITSKTGMINPETRGAYKIIERIKSAAAADVAPVRHGQWIVKGYVCEETEYQCSECKETEWRTSASRLKYCPFCGAKMDGGAD